MNCRSCLAVLILLPGWCATPASAYLDTVSAPGTVETGTPFSVFVAGDLPSPCWELLDHQWHAAAGVLTVDITTAYTADPGVACLAVLVPFEVIAEITLNEPGTWLLRVVEHRLDPTGPPLSDLVIERTITATGTVTMEQVIWGTLRASYR